MAVSPTPTAQSSAAAATAAAVTGHTEAGCENVLSPTFVRSHPFHSLWTFRMPRCPSPCQYVPIPAVPSTRAKHLILIVNNRLKDGNIFDGLEPKSK
jgi:hypothetical protein